MALCPDLSHHSQVRGPLGRLGVPALGPAVIPVIAVGLALVLLAGVVAAALRPGTAGADTVLHRGDDVVVRLADGAERPLDVGASVPGGAVVVAGRDGAVLRTRDRDTWLGAGSEVAVVDGARQELREGLVMVDARRGPALELTTVAAEVTTPEGAVSRVERSSLLRVGAYDGEPVTVTPAGRSATTPVPRDHQVQVPQGGLPGRVTPLVLTPGDPYERALAPLLVGADEALRAVAGRLDEPGPTSDAVSAAALRDLTEGDDLPTGAPVSERALAYLLARTADDVAVVPGYAVVRGLRGDGGSWGVVADLVGAEVPEVASVLDGLLGPGAAVLAGEELDVPTLLELVGAGPPPAPGEVPAAGPPAAPGTGSGPSGRPGPGTPPPSSSPPPSAPAPPPPDGPPPPTDPVTELVDTVVDTVIGLLPSPAPTPPPPPTLPTLPTLPSLPPGIPLPLP